MNSVISPCGCDCPRCESFLKNECAGCRQIEGRVWWADYVDAVVCPVFECAVQNKKLENCGLCTDMPCSLWHELKDPRHSDEEHAASIAQRVNLLKKKA